MQNRSNSTFRLVVAVLIVMVVTNVALVGLFILPGLRKPSTSLPPQIATQAPTSSPTGTPSLTPRQTAGGVTRTPTPLSAQEGLRQEGVIFLSLSDGKFKRLFAYHPQYLPLTRLTNGAWDDIQPAASRDGARLAFSSRQNGYWDIIIQNLNTGQPTRLTDTPEYDGAPTWSPDSQWLAYESYINNHLQIIVRSLADPNQPPLNLTSEPGSNFSPSWSPQGREIAFVSTREGSEDIWVARLDRVDDRFINLTSTSTGRNRHPNWSPDGRYLAWASDTPGVTTLYVWDSQSPNSAPRMIGNGDFPVWRPDGKVLLAEIRSPNQTALGAYSLTDGSLVFPANRLPGALHGLDWQAGQAAQALASLNLPDSARLPSPVLWQRRLSTQSPVPSQRAILTKLNDLNVPYPFLHDNTDEAFDALRIYVGSEAGWDFLGNLNNAYLPLTSPTHPGQEESWLYTGRAFAINAAPISAGWMAVEREDIGGLTYWRIFIRARFQDGSQGLPLIRRPWDLNARYKGQPKSYEQGGEYSEIPDGYWIDFTEVASRFSWERLPSQINWRTFYPAALFDTFVMREGLDWRSAMTQVYPPEAISTPTPVYTFTPTITRTPTPWYNWMITPSLTSTITPTATRRPTFTPNP